MPLATKPGCDSLRLLRTLALNNLVFLFSFIVYSVFLFSGRLPETLGCPERPK